MKILGFRLFSYHKGEGLFWFSILGKGLSFKNISIFPLTFSERNKLSKFIKFGNIVVSAIK
jgi:hypothetical protein